AALFLERQTRHYGKSIGGFSDAALRALLAHRWPGNVRELEHVVERAVLMARATTVEEGNLGLIAGRQSREDLEGMTLEEAERVLIRRALDRHGGNVTRAAEDLGVSRSALYRRLEKHEI
ncbi:MAG TPA: helix-turn-helix domain-containing protein, partial [Thermoanaerobaculia bacterium]|nr:helix-turn-helix domain-containing protein [Thermoanaerobaculia bacterium]